MSALDWLEEDAGPRGFRAAGVRAGIKTAGPDLALIVSDGDAAGAAVFTQNIFCAPPVTVSREHAANGRLSAIIANSGCANACTGEPGVEDARSMAAAAAGALSIPADRVIVCSTGIIGQRLPMEKIHGAVPEAVGALSPTGFRAAAEAIMTTDTSRKQAAVAVEIDGARVVINGMIKGAGMVSPRMATVLAFFATDARVEPAALQEIFARAVHRTLNRVTVDSDTSTNDTACILASGAAGNAVIAAGTPAAGRFEEGLTAVGERLARLMARGGEGANHLITVRVLGAGTESDAEVVARSIADSPLVKTAIFGRDPNWGRIAMAAGKAGVAFLQERAAIRLNGIPVMENGTAVTFDVSQVRRSLQEDEITIEIDLGQGSASATVWTCDFSYEYVKINAEYHT